MNVVGLILALGAGITFLGGTIQGLVAWHSADPQLQRRLRPSIIGCVLLTIALVGASYYSIQSTTSAHTPSPPSFTPSATATSAHTPSSSSSTPSATATSAPTSNDYSAAQPGPGCDTNGGTWTPQGLNQIQCGTTISSDYNSLGYLYLQLPKNAIFSSTNKISIMGGNLSYVTGPVCLGLAEQGTNTGVLGEYCGNGGWFIYSLSSTGVITQMLNKGITSERPNEEISLTLQSNTVLFSIDTETYKAPLSSIQPVKVAITSFNETPNNYNTISITNFSYITQPD